MSTELTGGPKRSRAALILVLAGGTLAVAALVAFLKLQRPVDFIPGPGRVANGDGQPPPDKGPAPPNLTPDQCRRLLEIKSQALAMLENGGVNNLREAEPLLVELAEMLPNDAGVARNLAVARLVGYEDSKTEERRKLTVEPIEAAIEADRRLEPRSAVSYLLAARLAEARRVVEFNRLDELEAAAEAALTEAATIDPDNAAVWYALYTLANQSNRPELKAKALPALREVARLEPKNSHVMVKLAYLQAEEKEFAAARDTLEEFQSWLPRLLQSPDRPTSLGAAEAVAQAEKSLQAEQWPQARNDVLKVSNLIVGDEWEASDRRRVVRHPLNYIVLDFASGLCPLEIAGGLDDEAPLANVTFRSSGEQDRIPLAGVVDLLTPDFDLDGRADIMALAGGRVEVFGRTEGGEAWQSLAAVETLPGMSGLLTADLDRDLVKTKDNGLCNQADMDVVAWGSGGVQVFRNEIAADTPSRQLTLVEQSEAFPALRNVLAATLVDIDHDGDLDLALSTADGLQIWANRGEALFYDITDRSALPPDEVRSTALVAVDFDRDLDLDLMLAGPNQPAGYLENLRHGVLRWQALPAGFSALNQGVTSLAAADLTGTASWDLLGGSGEQLVVVRTETLEPGQANARSPAIKLPAAAAKLAMFDLDNDSYSDVVGWAEGRLTVLGGTANGLQPISREPFDEVPTQVAACAVADMDADGDGDLVIASDSFIEVYDNDGGNKNHWINLRVRGEIDDKGTGRVNHYSIGSTAELKFGPWYREQMITGQVTHFGLGPIDKPDVLRVLWTNGVPQVIVHPQPDSEICEVHRLSSSCPYLYTWDGERFVFLTDTCWNAPLGLQHVEGVFAQPRAWEYLKIAGDKLLPRDGQYTIQLTEELWEATYFDSVKLIAVDHPADVQVFTNEKVGPPEISQFKIHTVSQPREPAAARDKHGRDVAEVLRRVDGDFFRGYDRLKMMGYVDEHYLELDLGDLQDPQAITLFLTGWLRPTDTSLNVAISQNPDWPRRRPPAIYTPDASGEWREVRPFMGFPGGKTKTIAVDLSGLFTPGDYRLRIVTNFELYWDQAFFTVDEPKAELRLAEMRPAAADLHFRGFSAVRDGHHHGPDSYDYGDVSTIPKFAPMRGNFTRYGDVAELLAADDDRLAVLGSGDEMTVSFDMPADDPPAGWKRDFLLYNNGWDKDAVLATAYGQQVEPLPFQAMHGYPFAGDEAFPDSPHYRGYLAQYQTRRQDHAAFWRLLRGAGDTRHWPTDEQNKMPSNCGQHVRPGT
ncbi:MAG: FG-GAP-like repeat-containing protein [Pirellulales bacterium]